jgi:uncharacterized membrane protein
METMQSIRRPPVHAADVPATGERARRAAVDSFDQSGLAPSAVDTLAIAIGWFSLGLGLAQLVAPRALGHALGVGEHAALLRALGARELASGLGILSGRERGAWMKARVAGDALDLALLALSFRAGNGRRPMRIAAAAAAVAGVAALDVLSSRQQSDRHGSVPGEVRRDGSIRVEKSVAVNRQPQECYAMWRNFANLPRFMRHLRSVALTGDNRSHWVANAPAGTSVEWDAEVTHDEPNALIAWRSLEGAGVENAGAVRFLAQPSGRGTIVSVKMQYKPPAGAIGAAIAKLFGEEPAQQVQEDLRRFRQIMEAGEIATTDGQPAGRRGALYRVLRRGAR